MAVLFNPNGRQIDHCGQIVFTRLGQKMNRYKRVVGVDVCKERLDIADSTNAIPMAVDYSIDEIRSKIVSKIKDPKNTLVVCEATGGLEYDLVDALHDAQINVCVANPAYATSQKVMAILRSPTRSTPKCCDFMVNR